MPIFQFISSFYRGQKVDNFWINIRCIQAMGNSHRGQKILRTPLVTIVTLDL